LVAPSDKPRIRILIIDDHFVARFGLRGLLESQPDMEVIGEAHDGSQALAAYLEHKPDLVLMDSRMPQMDGSAATAVIRKTAPDARILMLSSFDTEAEIQRALDAGASGYIMKEAEPTELLVAIRAVAAGKGYLPGTVEKALERGRDMAKLSERELKMLEFIAQGMSNREIAAQIALTPGSVRIYVSNLFEKMGVGNRSEAISVALQRGLIRPSR
jgi:two-component system, NarL family, response regulator